MVKLADTFHFFGSFESLSVINNEKQIMVFFCEQAEQHIQCDLLHYNRFIPDTSPEKFAVIGSVRSVSEGLNKPVYSAAVTDADRQYKGPEVAMDMFRNLLFNRFEKTFQFSRDFADCSHTASLHISFCLHNAYRQTKLFLFDNCYHQNLFNRSV
jgi:hypothetical protein